MARLNNRPSTVRGSSIRPSPTPAPSNSSDQENRDPRPRDKGKGRAMDPPSRRPSALPTPTTSSESSDARGQKRKRTEQSIPEESTQGDIDPQDEAFTRYFDPNQDPEIRRQVKRKSRAIEREFNENRDQFLRDDGAGLKDTIDRANTVFKSVKQTNDATLDSRLFVNVSDLASKKAAQLVLGDKSSGIDVDVFLSKCISFMKNGGPADAQEDEAATQRRRSRRRDEEDEDEDEDVIGEPLDWEVLGHHACFPYNRRPACPSFLLGPLSVEKKQRKQTQRTARQTKDNSKETRPEALSRTDLNQADENGLTQQCTRIRKHLAQHIRQAGAKMDAAKFSSLEELNSTERGKAFRRKNRITAKGGPILFDFVLNPHSFGQTVENLFYISFLIKEGHIAIVSDQDGLPVLINVNMSDEDKHEHSRKADVKRHQSVFSLDWQTWQDLIKAFDVTEPMIPHRSEESAAQVGARGWYT